MANDNFYVLPSHVGRDYRHLRSAQCADWLHQIVDGNCRLIPIAARLSSAKATAIFSNAQIPVLFPVCFLLLIGAYNNLIGAGEGTFARLGIMLLFGLTFLQSYGLKTIATAPLRVCSLIVTGLAGLICLALSSGIGAGGFLAGKYATRHIKKVPENT